MLFSIRVCLSICIFLLQVPSCEVGPVWGAIQWRSHRNSLVGAAYVKFFFFLHK